jgi:beta-glucosidase-like glycosyl hydrolase
VPLPPILVPAIRLDGKDPEGEARRAVERARRPWVAGFCLFGGEARAVDALLERVREAAGRPIFVASDMERGAGQQVAGLSSLPDAGLWGSAATVAETEAFGALTAAEARSVGVDVLFAPVLDVRSEPENPIVGNRAFGWDPDLVADHGAAFCRGALSAGALPVGKHYPGHGPTDQDSHDAVPVVRESRRRLLARDLLPFDRVVGEGVCPAVMTAHVAYPALDPSGAIATFSAPILDRVREAAPDPDQVCVITDALLMEGAARDRGEDGAARLALEAGADLLLYPSDPEVVARALERDGPSDAVLARAAGRAAAFLARLHLAAGEARPLPPSARDVPGEVSRRAVGRVWREGARAAWIVVLDDDGLPGRGRVLEEAARRAGVPATVVNLPGGDVPPERLAVREGTAVVLMASIRAWKGASGVSDAGRRAVGALEASAREEGRPLRLVCCGPRPLPGALHVPGTGPDVERALAERLLGGRRA